MLKGYIRNHGVHGCILNNIYIFLVNNESLSFEHREIFTLVHIFLDHRIKLTANIALLEKVFPADTCALVADGVVVLTRVPGHAGEVQVSSANYENFIK